MDEEGCGAASRPESPSLMADLKRAKPGNSEVTRRKPKTTKRTKRVSREIMVAAAVCLCVFDQQKKGESVELSV